MKKSKFPILVFSFHGQGFLNSRVYFKQSKCPPPAAYTSIINIIIFNKMFNLKSPILAEKSNRLIKYILIIILLLK